MRSAPWRAPSSTCVPAIDGIRRLEAAGRSWRKISHAVEQSADSVIITDPPPHGTIRATAPSNGCAATAATASSG
ncbi:hypothetical protein DSL92_06555 [Billgrantia gudaonensis]|uniref:Uncharacterized protein n=1 Tax=Billgrantia gudaonensis TaxID=376427 RepID=A0A432JIM9_9GAMM|nr:hypothetical protein DSL92_06555 [Halomonas gudaonensis]